MSSEIFNQIISTYSKNSTSFLSQYESVSFESVHAELIDIAKGAHDVLDVGAGSGRDAAWFANNGASVVAVEPAGQLRDLASSTHLSGKISWFDDQLPSLDKIVDLGLDFDLIWLSAVWMHLTTEERLEAYQRLYSLLKPDGHIMISLRHGSSPEDRPMFPVSIEELVALSSEYGGKIVSKTNDLSTDKLGRGEVQWQTVLIKHVTN